MKKNPKTKECNHCGKRINVSSSNCPLCGGRTKDPLEPRAAICPRCEVRLKDEVIFEDMIMGKPTSVHNVAACGSTGLNFTERLESSMHTNTTREKGSI